MPVRQFLCPGRGAIAEQQPPQPAGFQMRGEQVDHLAGADQQRGLLGHIFEDLLGQQHPGEGKRHRIAPDAGLRARALGGFIGLLEQAAQGRPDRLGRFGIRKRLLDLAENLRLAEHHRVQAGGHAENMPDGLGLFQAVAVAAQGVQVDR